MAAAAAPTGGRRAAASSTGTSGAAVPAAKTQKDDGALFVRSADTLRGDQPVAPTANTNHSISAAPPPPPWSDRPPLFAGSSKERHELKLACRSDPGVPPSLRCAVWTTSVMRAAHPHRPKEWADEYGTRSRVESIEHTWKLVLDQTFAAPEDEACATMPDFGLHQEDVEDLLRRSPHNGGKPLPQAGRRSLIRVLSVLRHMHSAIEYAPLVPDQAAVLLTHMPEAYAYVTLREMVCDHSQFLPPSKVDHYSYCRAFAQLLKRLHPETARQMEDTGALTPRGLDPIFRRFFVTLLRYDHVLRIMDIYTIEGAKVLFRFGVALIAMHKSELKAAAAKGRGADAHTFWKTLRDCAHSPRFNFNALVKRAYGSVGSKWRRKINFPRRRTLARMVRFNEEWAATHVSATNPHVPPPPPPLGYVKKDDVPIELALPTSVRAALAEWMPLQYRSTKLDLIFSTNVHGRSLSAFYDRVSRTKHTVCLVEVLGTGATIGMFASQAWVSHKRPKIYGDGGCFLFRASPDPECYKWRPSEDDTQCDALLEQFQVSSEEYIAMGANKDGSSGLRLNEDMTRGESAPAAGFNNEPLAGSASDAFEVGVVEVYRLVREIDGVPVDGEDDHPAWALK
eukprot:CAMPEP_0185809538 /NCGR_PEP_ID=MMETSP1322-20130828/6256_1 /TAXON_ID=265543 /ORGANISM="Minutocellus polymorphus, Strain RCC2270" /LENGTH=622 /DNA_ID=CAMNT_0028505811 /DNA_START=121 /DNA_END=1989 /DNA_ORIENTATION=+